MEISSIRTPGLGDSTYIATHDGVAIVVDPQRDFERFLDPVRDAGADVAYVLETHLHNDYVSGGRELARVTGADLVLPAASGAAFAHVPAFHLEDFVLGPLAIRPIHTPGHTPEHTSYLLFVDDEPVVVFSGGSLLVGSAGRTDLLGADRARQLARLQYISVNRLAELPDDVQLCPTHGEGSFCTTTGAGIYTSTIGTERRSSLILKYPDQDSFVEGQLGVLSPYPTYYAHMGPTNLMGPEPLPDTSIPELRVGEIPEGAHIVDIRLREHFAAGHLVGSLGFPDFERVAVWAGWLLPFDSAVVLVATPDQDVEEIVRQFARIGFDHVVGVVYDLSGADLIGYRTVDRDEFVNAVRNREATQVVDVRAPDEWDIFHIEGSLHHYVPDLLEPVDDLEPDEDVWVVCATGFRATIAAGLLERAGYRPVVVDRGGVADLIDSPAITG